MAQALVYAVDTAAAELKRIGDALDAIQSQFQDGDSISVRVSQR